MLQAFIIPIDGGYGIENIVLYGNKAGFLADISLDRGKVEESDKYRQFFTIVRQYAAPISKLRHSRTNHFRRPRQLEGRLKTVI